MPGAGEGRCGRGDGAHVLRVLGADHRRDDEGRLAVAGKAHLRVAGAIVDDAGRKALPRKERWVSGPSETRAAAAPRTCILINGEHGKVQRLGEDGGGGPLLTLVHRGVRSEEPVCTAKKHGKLCLVPQGPDGSTVRLSEEQGRHREGGIFTTPRLTAQGAEGCTGCFAINRLHLCALKRPSWRPPRVANWQRAPLLAQAHVTSHFTGHMTLFSTSNDWSFD